LDISDPEMGGSTLTNFNVDAIQDLQSSSGWITYPDGSTDTLQVNVNPEIATVLARYDNPYSQTCSGCSAP